MLCAPIPPLLKPNSASPEADHMLKKKKLSLKSKRLAPCVGIRGQTHGEWRPCAPNRWAATGGAIYFGTPMHLWCNVLTKNVHVHFLRPFGTLQAHLFALATLLQHR